MVSSVVSNYIHENEVLRRWEREIQTSDADNEVWKGVKGQVIREDQRAFESRIAVDSGSGYAIVYAEERVT